MPKDKDDFRVVPFHPAERVEPTPAEIAAANLEKERRKITKVKTLYTKELGASICERIAEGETLTAICRDLGMHVSTVIGWTGDHEDFGELYRQARLAQCDYWADQMLDIADNTEFDTETVVSGNGRVHEKANHEWIQRSRVRIDTRRWLLGKLRPEKYAEKPREAEMPPLEEMSTEQLRQMLGRSRAS